MSALEWQWCSELHPNVLVLFKGYLNMYSLFADGTHLRVFYLYSYRSLECRTFTSTQDVFFINVALTVDVYKCCLTVFNKATILFVNVLLGFNGDTHQSIRNPFKYPDLSFIYWDFYYYYYFLKSNVYNGNRIYMSLVFYFIFLCSLLKIVFSPQTMNNKFTAAGKCH